MNKGKIYRKITLLKKCVNLGLSNVFLFYSQDEGWWLECDEYDDWIGMTSYAANKKIEEIAKEKNNNK
jgi:hypothetical protein